MKQIPFVPSSKSCGWLLNQFQGLAHAINDVHNLWATYSRVSTLNNAVPDNGMKTLGWHHDLKPANILFFSRILSHDHRYCNEAATAGDFSVADFGSGKVYTCCSGSISTRSPNGTPTYEPPEVFSEGATSRPYDVWSLGCLFLELIIWAVFGYESVRQFSHDRHARRHPYSETIIIQDDAFWQVGPDNRPIVRPSVVNWIARVKQTLEESDAYHFREILDLIFTMPDSDGIYRSDQQIMLDANPKTRIPALTLWHALNHIIKYKESRPSN